MPALSPNQAPPLPARRSSRHRRAHSSNTQRKLRRLRLLAWLLFAGNLVASILGIFGHGQLQRLRTEANTLVGQVRQLEVELARARDRETELTTDMRVLLANRIPGVAQLGFGRTLEVDERYVRSVTFNRVGVGTDQPIEYRLSVRNGGVEPLVPRVRILLFDQAGLQTGSAEVGSDDAAQADDLAALPAGESRTYTGRIASFRDAPPAYFLVEAR